jgi:hypothetical protein
MPELAIKPLPSDPLTWTDVDMWGWVNDVSPLADRRACSNGALIEMLQSDAKLRAVYVKFSRNSLVSTQGYNWDNHVADEMVQIEFLSDRIILMVVNNLNSVLLARLLPVAAMVRMADNLLPSTRTGSIPMSIGDGDWGQTCLAFASQSASPWLVPDPYFFLTLGYEKEREEIALNSKPWHERRSQIYWRGAPSGLQKYEDHAESQRVRLVLNAASSQRTELYNVRFAGLDGMSDEVAKAVIAVGGDGPREPQMNILDYRYNVDVDGWSCAWTGFFIKLLAGSPVLKITSDRGFRQWYYDALKPWQHLVPVAADLSDLDWAVTMLEARPDWAEAIGTEGKLLAESMTYRNQLEQSGRTIARFLEVHT